MSGERCSAVVGGGYFFGGAQGPEKMAAPRFAWWAGGQPTGAAPCSPWTEPARQPSQPSQPSAGRWCARCIHCQQTSRCCCCCCCCGCTHTRARSHMHPHPHPHSPSPSPSHCLVHPHPASPSPPFARACTATRVPAESATEPPTSAGPHHRLLSP